VDESARVAPLIQITSSDPSLERHFSSFALTSHLHSPVLRLVSLHPSLYVTISFLRVPEIHDGFSWKCFFSRTATVADVSQSILDALGLTRSLPGPGGGTVLYVLEDVWAEGDAESELRPSFSIPSLIYSQRLPHSLRMHVSLSCYLLPRPHLDFPRRRGVAFDSQSRTSGIVALDHALRLPCRSSRRNLQSRRFRRWKHQKKRKRVEQPSKSLHTQLLKSLTLRRQRRVLRLQNGANLYLKLDYRAFLTAGSALRHPPPLLE
jgi:hypothetical protein